MERGERGERRRDGRRRDKLGKIWDPSITCSTLISKVD